MINKDKFVELSHQHNSAEYREIKKYVSKYDDDDIVVIKTVLFGESQTGYWMKELPQLDVYAVPSRYLSEIKRHLDENDWLNKVAAWIKRLESASNVIRDVNRERSVHYKDGKMYVVDENGKKVKLP